MITHEELDKKLLHVFYHARIKDYDYYQRIASELYQRHLYSYVKGALLNEAQLKVLVDCGL